MTYKVTISLILAIALMQVVNAESTIKNFQLNKEVMIPMSWIQANEYMMGADQGFKPEREKRHHVKVSKGYWMATTETTQLVWTNIMNNNPSKFIGLNRPVEQVDWADIKVFISKLNNTQGKFRLPTEAEWELACQAGAGQKHNEVDSDSSWHSGNSDNSTHEVALKKPNNYGLYDMKGNVLEWNHDDFVEDNSKLYLDPSVSSAGAKKNQRGGQYSGRVIHSRCSDRQRGTPNEKASFLGFRLVLIPD